MPKEPTDSGTTEAIEGQPNPEIDGGSTSAELEAVLQKALAPFQKDLDEVKSQQRALQGEKDRATKRTEDKVEKLLAEWESAKKTGVSQEEFIDRKRSEERLAHIEELLAAQTATGTKPVGTGESPNALDVARAFAKAANIQENDPEYLKLLAANATDQTKLIEGLTSLVVSRANKPTPTDAQAPSPVAGVKKEPDTTALVAELQKLQIHPTKNVARIEEIEKLLGW